MAWLLFLLPLAFTVTEAANVQTHLPSAMVVGTVFCDTCSHHEFSKASRFISGAFVAVECSDGGESSAGFYREGKTDEHGEFKVQLPDSVAKEMKKIKGCYARLLSSSDPFCAVTSKEPPSSPLQPKGRNRGTHVFSAGFLAFRPLKRPDLCNQNPAVSLQKHDGASETQKPLPVIIPLPALPGANLPPIPAIPLLTPVLPKIPPLNLPLPPLPKLQQRRPEDASPSKQGGPDAARKQLLPPLVPPIIPSPAPAIGPVPLPQVPFLSPPGLLPPLPPLPPLPLPLPPIPGIPGLGPPSQPPPILPSLPPLLRPGIPLIPGPPRANPLSTSSSPEKP